MLNTEYDNVISWLFQQFPSYQKIGQKAYKPNLDNINNLVQQLSIPFHQLNYIHVAGTNGKGTTCSILASTLKEAGYNVGLYTSPHIVDFRERIRINGNKIEESDVIKFVEKTRKTKLSFSPSFFEITWAMALDHFIKEKCDIVIVETGLGGRLDATNIIDPILSVITSIGLDHTDILGETRSQIAKEKCGIIKKKKPIISGFLDPEIKPIFINQSTISNSLLIEVDTRQARSYFDKNQLIVEKTLEILNKNTLFNSSASHLELGIKNIYQNSGYRGRLQKIHDSPTIILDGAHNKEGVIALLDSIDKLYQYNNLHIIYGASNDKNIEEIIDLFPSVCNTYFVSFNHPRSATIERYQPILSQKNKKFQFHPNALNLLSNLKSTVNKNDMVLIFGSFFLLEDFLKKMD